ncbi:MAG: oligosaccharide flippase family protein [Anaerolineae bacterium]
MIKKSLIFLFIIFLLPLLLFWQVTFGDKTLLPADNLFSFEPWRSFAEKLGVSQPHNPLLSDLILENYVWKRFILQAIHERQIPLWNPYLFAGLPFLAAGQHSALYPLSVLFYVLPLAKAYGYFTVLQLFLAGLFAYFYARTIGMGRLASLLTGLTYMLSGFMVASVVFPMIIAAASWLPLLLAIIERLIRTAEPPTSNFQLPTSNPNSLIPWAIAGGLALGMQLLAGHVEISYYVLFICAFYALWRLLGLWWNHGRRSRVVEWSGGQVVKRKTASPRSLRPIFRPGLWLAVMVALGLGLGAVQFIPLYEVARLNFRQGTVAYQDVIGWAFPPRRAISFLVPNFFGNPAHHSYLDVFTGQVVPFALNAYGAPNPNGPGSSDWGVKNYVEGASYLGLLPLLLAGVAVLARPAPFRRYIWLFSVLAAFSLAFTFGTPLYALLYYFLPGFNQLHTPFRWVFPYTLSLAVLAGIGAEHLGKCNVPGTFGSAWHVGGWLTLKARPSAITILGGMAFWGGLLVIIALALSRIFFSQIEPWVEKAFWALAKAPEAFPDHRAFYSYEFHQLLLFGLLLMAAGIILRLSRCPIFLPRLLGGRPAWEAMALSVLALDLFAFGYGFNPAADPKLLDFKPPVVDFLQKDKELYRFTTFVAPGEKTFQANVGMFYNLYDVRGYDSIFPKQYADFMGLIEEQDELLYNRIAPFSELDSLDSPLLDLLNVKYVLTTRHIPNPGYKLVYDGEIKVYQNEDYLPRAFIVPRADVIEDAAQRAAALKAFDPRQLVILENGEWGIENGKSIQPPTSNLQPLITNYAINEVIISATLPYSGWLVLADSFFPGWKAYDQQAGKEEQEIPVYRADGNFRAVYLGPGEHLVRFKYTPMSFKVGLYTSFMAGVVLLLLFAYWLWGRYYRESEEDSTIKRVAKNSLTPMALSLLNKLIDMAFAMLMLRILAPEGAGRYQFAVVFIGYFEILVRFGLGTLLTREVARERSQANRYLSNVTILRTFLWLFSLPLMATITFFYLRFGNLTWDTVAAIALFAAALLFSNVADALSAVFYAYEKMEYPAAISTVTALTRVGLGTFALLLGLGVVGLAGVSLIANLVTVALLLRLLMRLFFRPRPEFDPAFEREMLDESFPLMINHLLATIFFRIDIMILKPLHGDRAIGYYGAALKYVDGLNVIPSYFTMAIFPLMSRYAQSARESLIRAYILSLRILLIISLPIAVGTPFIARELILILGGGEYLPDSMIALQLLIGFLPFSFINSVTQYVLIAINQQRFLTKAFLIGVAFNMAANLLFIPAYSYKAAAVITIFSELALLIPFYYCVRRNLTPIPWLSIFWQPSLASAAMGVFLWLLRDLNFLITVPLAAVVYMAVLILVGTFSSEEMRLILKFLPTGRPASVPRSGVR